MILGAIFGLLAAASWGASDFVSLVPSRRIGYYLTASFLQLVGLVEVSAYVFIVNPSILSLAVSNPRILLVNFLVGILGFLSILFLLRGFLKGVMSIVSPIASTYPVFTIILSVLFLSATVGGIQAVGIALLLTGIILAGFKVSELRKAGVLPDPGAPSSPVNLSNLGNPATALEKPSRFGLGSPHKWITKGVGSALGTALCAGFVFFGLGFVTPVFGSILPVFVIKGAATGASFALLIPLKQKFQVPNGRTMILLIFVGALDALGLIFFNLGILTAGASFPIVVTISSLGTVLTIILANVFYKERLDQIQYFGILVLLVGLSTVLYFSQ